MSYALKDTPGSRESVLAVGTNSTYFGHREFDLETGTLLTQDLDGLSSKVSQPAGAAFVSPFGDFGGIIYYNNTVFYAFKASSWSQWTIGNPFSDAYTLAANFDNAGSATGGRANVCYPGYGHRAAVSVNRAGFSVVDFSAGTTEVVSIDGLTAIDLAWSGNVIAVSVNSMTSPLRLYDATTLASIPVPTGMTFLSQTYARVAVSPSGRFVAIASVGTSTTTGRLYIADLLMDAYFENTIHSISELFFPDDFTLIVNRTSDTSYGWNRIYEYTEGTSTWGVGSASPLPLPEARIFRIKNTSCGKYTVVCTVSTAHIYRRSDYSLVRSIGTRLNALLDVDIGPVGHSISNVNGLPVRDPAGNPVPGVTVTTFRRGVPAFNRSEVTDENGRFLIPMGSASPQTVIFEGKELNEGSVLVDRVVPV